MQSWPAPKLGAALAGAEAVVACEILPAFSGVYHVKGEVV